jgi:autotransporter-associated beta strand protein
VRLSAWFLVSFQPVTCWPGLLGLILIGSRALYGQDVWQGPNNGSWFTPANWSLGAPPTNTERAAVTNGTTSQIAATGAVATTLTIGTPGSTVQLLPGGSLSVNHVAIDPGGTLRFSGGGSSGGTLFVNNIQNNGNILFDGPLDQALNIGVHGSGSLTMAGTGILTLNANDTYSGATIVNAGTVQAGSTIGLSPNSAFTVNSILDLNGFNNTIGSLSGAGTVLNNGAATATLTSGNDNSNSTFSGVLKDGTSVLQFAKSGTGTLILTGDNTYTGGTTIDEGSMLQLGNGGASGSITGNVVDNGILAFDRGGVSTFGGVISGPGSVQQIGSGTTVLTGDNTYTGGTTIVAGTLQLGNGGTSGRVPGDITDNGTLAFDRSDVFTLGGVISGTGGVQQIGSGITVLTGTNTYAGGTTITAGTLQLGDGGTTGSITGNVVDNGILAFNRSDVVTFGGAISGTGGVTQIGSGTTILAGNNRYSGATTVTSGTLQAGSANGFSPNSAFTVNSILDLNGFSSTIGSLSGTGTVLNNGAANATLTAGADNRNSTFGGVLADGAGVVQLIKSGGGVLTLTANNTYTGTTTVDGGSLIVDGSIASVQALVNTGGLLGGRGTIGGSVINSGIVSPGDSPGTLIVSGNYAQNPNGTLRIEVAGTGPGQFDVLQVGGHASLAGSLQLIRVGAFQLHVGDKLTFLTAGRGVSGTFSNVQNGFVGTGTVVQGEVIALPKGIVLEGQQGSFATTPGIATTPNNLAVAKALDSAAGDPRAAALFAFLNSEPLANLPHDLTLIAPTQISSINATSVSLGNVQASNVGQRLANIRAGSTGFSSAGFAINGGQASFAEGFAGVTGAEGKSGPSVLAPVPENRWGVFLTGLGEFTSVDSTSNAAGYDVDTGGFTIGADYRLTPNFAIGLFGGYAHTNVDLVGGGDIDVNSGKVGLYATLFGNGFHLDTAVSGGPSGYDTNRTALLGNATGNTDGADVDVLVAAGYEWKHGGLSIGPTATFQFSYVGLDGFTESGSLAPLKFPDQNNESERTAFGAKASYDWKIGHITVIPQISAAWLHEYGATAYSVVANFANGAGTSFTVNGPEIGRDGLLIGAGVSVLWSDRISTYVYYDGEVGRTNYQSHSISGGIRVTF